MWYNVFFGVILFLSIIVISCLLSVAFASARVFENSNRLKITTPVILVIVAAGLLWFLPIFLIIMGILSLTVWRSSTTGSFYTYGITFIVCLAATVLVGVAYGIGINEGQASNFKSYTLASLIYLAVLDVLLLIGFIMGYRRRMVMPSDDVKTMQKTVTITETVSTQ